MNTFVVTEHIPIESARKDIDYGTNEPFNFKNRDHISEWAMAVALSKFPIGNTVTMVEWRQAVCEALFDQEMDAQIEAGNAVAFWNERTSSLDYALTEQGEKVTLERRRAEAQRK